MAEVCPVIGTTTSVLPPDHPALSSDPEARCPVTNAKVAPARPPPNMSLVAVPTTNNQQVSHHNDIIHSHPSSSTIPHDKEKSMDASQCPALQNANSSSSLTDATCPVVGPVSAMLPPNHPQMTEEAAGKICPVTNATLEHHKGNVAVHPSVPEGSPVQKCPVAKGLLK